MSVPAFNQPIVNLPNDATRHGAEAKANTTGAAAPATGPASKGPSFGGPETKLGPVLAGVQSDAARGGQASAPWEPAAKAFSSAAGSDLFKTQP